ncbi:GNAT family N-acetyltransferase [Methanogenium cariaci]|jgi:GNAT superfamily N-acetyltransferase
MITADEHRERAGLKIRVAVLADGEMIAANNSRIACETEGRVLDSKTVRDGTLSVLEDPANGWYLVAEYNDTVAAQCLITLEWSDWRNGHCWWIQSVYVVPEFRRKGIFSAMYAWISAEACNCPDVVGLRLYVEQDNLPAHETYRSLGMKRTPYVMYEDIFQENDKEAE